MENTLDMQALTQFQTGALLLGTFALGLVIGCVIAWGILRHGRNTGASRAQEIQDEFDDYREKVDRHFNQTSEMFRDVTTQYKKLYDHMAAGAVDLCQTEQPAMPRLEMQDAGEDGAVPQKPEDTVADEHPRDYTLETNGNGELDGDGEEPARKKKQG